jgi:hypothetical protein
LRVQVDAIRESGGERFQAQSDRATFYERVQGAFGSLADEEAQSDTPRTTRPTGGQ